MTTPGNWYHQEKSWTQPIGKHKYRVYSTVWHTCIYTSTKIVKTLPRFACFLPYSFFLYVSEFNEHSISFLPECPESQCVNILSIVFYGWKEPILCLMDFFTTQLYRRIEVLENHMTYRNKVFFMVKKNKQKSYNIIVPFTIKYN